MNNSWQATLMSLLYRERHERTARQCFDSIISDIATQMSMLI